MLLAARRLAYPALEHLGHTILDDVCVPTGRIANLLEGTEAIAEGVGLDDRYVRSCRRRQLPSDDHL